SILEPDSSAASVQRTIFAQSITRGEGPVILALGDSRMGFFPRLANEDCGKCGYQFSSGVIGGSSPRVWYYALREMGPKMHRVKAVIAPMHIYNGDLSTDAMPADRTYDLNYITPVLRLSDVIDLTRSFHSLSARWQALRVSLFKGFGY